MYECVVFICDVFICVRATTQASVYRDVCAETGKSEAELTKYLKVFWDRFEVGVYAYDHVRVGMGGAYVVS